MAPAVGSCLGYVSTERWVAGYLAAVNSGRVTVVGGGFAGCEAAWAAAHLGAEVTLYEMRPTVMTPAHSTHLLAELVCSNSFKSNDPESPPGQLKSEMVALGSVMIPSALRNSVPGGSALAVDREKFAAEVTSLIEGHPRIEVVRREWTPDLAKGEPTVIATGPLTSPSLSDWIASVTGEKHLYFYDAVSPTVMADTVDRSVVWEQSRYDKGEAAYLNCPMTKEEYERFVDVLLVAEQVTPHDFEEGKYFEGCMPIEEIARRGRNSLAFGNFKPVGLTDPRTGRRPHAVIQLRPENREKTMYSLVACQTRMKWGAQAEVFRLVPGLESAEFVRFGVMHRNTYLDSPRLIDQHLRFGWRGGEEPFPLFFAGQITGVEGYVESGATGILAGVNAFRASSSEPLVSPPRTTALGSLVAHVTNSEAKEFSPMNINWGLFPPLPDPPRDKAARRKMQIELARRSFEDWAAAISFVPALR